MFPKILKQLLRNKFVAAIIVFAVIIAGYFGYQGLTKKTDTVRYVTAAVEKGTLVVSVSGNGQVSASDQVDIKPKVSGEVVYLDAKVGQEVEAGALLVQIDSRAAEKAVRDAETALETTKLELEELLQPPDDYSLMQAENSLVQAKDTLTKLKFTQESKYNDALNSIKEADNNLENSYEDAFNTVANAFLDLPTIVTGLKDILYSEGISESERAVSKNSNTFTLVNSISSDDYNDRSKLQKFIADAEEDYKSARTKYEASFENYKNTSRYSDKEVIEALLGETLETVKATAETVKSEINVLDYWVDYRSRNNLGVYSKVTAYQSDLKSYTSKTNSHSSSLLSIQKDIESAKETKLTSERNLREMEQNNPLDLAAAERTIKEKEESLAKLKAGADELDIRAKKIAVQQKEDALLNAKEDLADHYVRAPFAGIIASVSAKKGESVASSSIAILITKQKIAEITLNEVDVASVKVGQKATITFDAIDDLTITGEVAGLDTLGTVSQGVVTYDAKIAFDTQDERVKPGMSISAEIITNAKQDVLMVPNAAIKSQGDTRYVEVMSDDNTVLRQQVEIGLSNDTYTEIVSGLEEGEKVVSSQTTSSSSGSSKNEGPTPSNGGSMEMIRIMR